MIKYDCIKYLTHSNDLLYSLLNYKLLPFQDSMKRKISISFHF